MRLAVGDRVQLHEALGTIEKIRPDGKTAVWPLHDVQAFMGHADIQTTMIYVHHIPKANAAQQFSEFVERQRTGDPALSGIRLGQDAIPAPMPVAANGHESREMSTTRP